ncbi:hypothetical protein E3226_000795 [Legionella geestiana]|uniref:hypothetical protein n=1 Tax=Legionella geestiana TaxID=45065 RepID=UPI0010920975|nr:hypothetical protein [Legionella geestiana]QDQ39043.1 hypothetical protein E3226_000795 [Legionella geestiana]
MKVVLSGISFQGSPIIWDYDEATNTAICTNTTTTIKAPILFSALAALLTRVQGIIVDDTSIRIDNASNFFEDNPMREVRAEQKPASSLSSAFFPRRSSSDPTSESPKRPASSSSAGALSPRSVRFTLPTGEELLSTLSNGSKPSFTAGSQSSCDDEYTTDSLADRSESTPSPHPMPERDLSLDSLIPNTKSGADLWGKTLCYEKHFLAHGGTTSPDFLPHDKYVFSAISLSIEVQRQKGDILYPLKSTLVGKIRTLFDVYLNPVWAALEVFDKQAIYPKVASYFQKAIAAALDNSSLNSRPTPLESISDIDELREALPSIHCLKAAIKHERTAVARIMLMPLDFFADPALQPSDVTDDEDITRVLVRLRSVIDSDVSLRQNIVNCLQQMITAVVESGFTEQHFRKETEHLETKLARKEPINGHLSFRRTLEAFLQQRDTNAFTEEHQSLLEETVRQSIQTINNHLVTRNDKMKRGSSFSITGGSLPLNTDFYLCSTWQEQLGKWMSDKLLHELDKILTPISKKTKGRSAKFAKTQHDALRNHFVTTVALFFDTVILDLNRQLSHNSTSPASCSSSSSEETHKKSLTPR